MRKLGILIVLLILAPLAGLALLGCGAQPAAEKPATTVQPVELKFAIWVPPVHKSVTEVYKPWAEAVEKETGGRVKITLYPGGALAKAPDTYDTVSSGGADLGAFNPGFTPGRFPLSGVGELPFMSPSVEVGSKIMQDLYDKYPQFQQEYGNVKALSIRVNVPIVLHTVKKPVRTVEDLKGMTIRANSPAGGDMLKALGATPVFMAMTELFTALERGTVDGAIYTVEAIQSFGLGPVTNYTTEAPITTVQSTLGMNIDTFNRLPKDVQNLITTGKLGKDWLRESQDRAMNIGQEEGYKILKAKGAGWQQIFLTSEEEAKWANTLRPLRDTWAEAREKEGKPGKAILHDWLDMLEKAPK